MTTENPRLDYGARFADGEPFDAFVSRADKNADLWAAQWKRASVPPDVAERVAAIPGRWRLLVLNEDWCGDAVNTVPLIARLAEDAPNLELRVIGRDANPDLMDRHLTNGSRSIPKVLVLDDQGAVRATWGPRPTELQAWVLGPGQALDKTERYKQVRTWYVRDRGATTLAEVADALEAAAATVAG